MTATNRVTATNGSTAHLELAVATDAGTTQWFRADGRFVQASVERDTHSYDLDGVRHTDLLPTGRVVVVLDVEASNAAWHDTPPRNVGLERAVTMTADELHQLRTMLAKWIEATTWSTVNATAVLADIDEDLAGPDAPREASGPDPLTTTIGITIPERPELGWEIWGRRFRRPIRPGEPGLRITVTATRWPPSGDVTVSDSAAGTWSQY